MEKIIIPVTKQLEPAKNYTIIWLGYGTAYRFNNGEWQEDKSYDYQFSVVQRRFVDSWKSIKNMHRLHPDYDGRGGPRNQVMYFELIFGGVNNGQIEYKIISSLGNGQGKSDLEFREQEINLDLTQSFVEKLFVPYNSMKITQHYKYEDGMLYETVELFKEKGGKIIPFMKMEEKAQFFLGSKLNRAPTIIK